MAIQSFISQVDLFTLARSCAGPLRVVLHQYQSGLEMLDLQMQSCPRPRPAQSPGCHTSFHYGVDGCKVHQYVDLANTAWGFYLVPPPCPEPPCPVVQTCDGIGADQYNTLPDGTPVTPPPLTGDDGTPNCQVIHVAIVRGVNAQGESIYCFDSPIFDPKAYNCLVSSLCQIFDAAGLVPNASTNLLVHIGELIGLDTVQLALDIIACQNAPDPILPPCNCDLGLSVLDTATINFSLAADVISGSVNISANAGNQVSAVGDGLFVPDTAYNDTNSINLTEAANVVTADLIVSPDAGNQLSVLANGAFVPTPDAYTSLVLTEAGASIDPALADIFIYDGAAPDTKQLITPAAGARNMIWVKNISADILTLSAAAVNGIDNAVAATIDLAPQSVGGFPFGNDGGDSAQLFYDAGLDTWLVL